MYLLPGTRLFRVPDELPSELAALTEVLAVTHGLDAARSMQALGGGFRLGDTVAVVGIGPLGLLHLAKAEMLGAGRLVAVDRWTSGSSLRAPSAPTLLPERAATAADERLGAVRDLTGGLGADVVVDCSGAP